MKLGTFECVREKASIFQNDCLFHSVLLLVIN